MLKTYVIDIDGTICDNDGDYETSIPKLDRIEKINALYDEDIRSNTLLQEVWDDMTPEFLHIEFLMNSHTINLPHGDVSFMS